jgi:hypothetical protein
MSSGPSVAAAAALGSEGLGFASLAAGCLAGAALADGLATGGSFGGGFCGGGSFFIFGEPGLGRTLALGVVAAPLAFVASSLLGPDSAASPLAARGDAGFGLKRFFGVSSPAAADATTEDKEGGVAARAGTSGDSGGDELSRDVSPEELGELCSSVEPTQFTDPFFSLTPGLPSTAFPGIGAAASAAPGAAASPGVASSTLFLGVLTPPSPPRPVERQANRARHPLRLSLRGARL